MNNYYKYQHTVKYSDTDSRYKMRIDRIISHFQDITGLHSTEMGVDGKTLLEKSNAFWVLTKMKIKILDAPIFSDTVEVETWPIAPSGGLRYNRDYTITKDGESAVLGTSEWCTLDCTDMKLRKIDTTCYPTDLNHRDARSGVSPYVRVRECVTDEHFHHAYTSSFTDIDTNRHTNNVTYIRLTLNCFTPDEFEALDIDEFQINYLSQTYYGDEILVYKKATDNGYYIEGRANSKTVFCSLISIK